jgi:adenylate kinase
MLDDLNTALDIVLELDVDNDEVVRRLSGRRNCRRCGRVWHVEFDPTVQAGVCDRCGGDLYLRDDDKPEVIKERLRIYDRDTSPLIDYYAKQGKVRGIDALGPVEDVTRRAIEELRSLRS